ncbi:MAG TPA: choice-of-anchor tandem repeat GloVer-containing protein [Rhizomicrobium sp.]|jgi:uncharacterized repeat protein (TIGR03803 family)
MFRNRDIAGKALLAAALASTAFVPLGSAQANKLTVLYSFGGKSGDGYNPTGRLLRDAGGNLYGATFNGGTGVCDQTNCGTVYRLAPDGTETVLHSFAGPYGDGGEPYGAGPIADRKGNLYGTTYEGGTHNFGAIYKLAPKGKETLLYSFTGTDDGGAPMGGLVRSGGNLYGTTIGGGAYREGTVFKLARDGTESVLHSFGSGSDGVAPYQGGLVADNAGNLYGTTSTGGAYGGGGTVFRVAPDGTEMVLYSFTGYSDGLGPYSGVILDKQGNIYGTTVLGGGTGCGENGCGTVFKLAPDGTETVLHAFTGGSDGSQPIGDLVIDKEGNLYGTTDSGGAGYEGVVFKLTPDGTETVLHAFNGGDGDSPVGGLILYEGNLYGTTAGGGANNAGTVFEVTK